MSQDARLPACLLACMRDALELRNALAAGYGGRDGHPHRPLLDEADKLLDDIDKALRTACAPRA